MYPIPSTQCRYAIYTRKSSESEERQIMSIEAQLDELNKRFSDLEIVSVIEESGSAFKPNNRPKFNALLEQISSGEINGIIAWHPDRLSRNPLDAAQVVHLIQTGKLLDLKFASYPFHNSPDGIMMLQISLSQSQFYSSKLSVDVKRGMMKKRDKGWRPNMAPVGYKNDPYSPQGEKKILVDEDRFPLIKRVFEMMLTGLYSAEYVRNKLNNEWGYLSPETKNRAGRPMNKRGIYYVLNNKFYAGIIKHPDGSESIGKHPAMITIEQFEHLQSLLKDRKGPHQQVLHFQYKPVLICGECNGPITAENKTKQQKNGNVHHYTYYHCTHNKKDYTCKQPSVEERKITAHLEDIIASSAFHPVLKTWAIHSLEENNIKQTREQTDSNLEATISKLEKRKEAAQDALFDQLISKEEYSKKKAELDNQLNKLKQTKSNQRAKAQKEKADFLKIIDFLFEGKQIIRNGTMEEKLELLEIVASNLSLKDKKVNVELNPWVIDIQNFNEKFKSRIERFEPIKNGSGIDLIHQNRDMYEIWSSTSHAIRTSSSFFISHSRLDMIRDKLTKRIKSRISTPSYTAFIKENLNQGFCQWWRQKISFFLNLESSCSTLTGSCSNYIQKEGVEMDIINLKQNVQYYEKRQHDTVL